MDSNPTIPITREKYFADIAELKASIAELENSRYRWKQRVNDLNEQSKKDDDVRLDLHARIVELESQLAAREEKPPRMFPIQPQRGAVPHPLWIHWEVAELAYSNYAARFGRSQSLEELARRGGFCPYEMDDQLPGWREMEAARGDLERENAELKSQLAAANKRAEDAEKAYHTLCVANAKMRGDGLDTTDRDDIPHLAALREAEDIGDAIIEHARRERADATRESQRRAAERKKARAERGEAGNG